MYLIGEIHPNLFVKHFLKILKGFNLEKYISPYNYNSKMKKLKNNMLSNEPSKPNINKIIKDIMIENKSNKRSLCYLGNDLTDYQTYKLIFN